MNASRNTLISRKVSIMGIDQTQGAWSSFMDERYDVNLTQCLLAREPTASALMNLQYRVPILCAYSHTPSWSMISSSLFSISLMLMRFPLQYLVLLAYDTAYGSADESLSVTERHALLLYRCCATHDARLYCSTVCTIGSRGIQARLQTTYSQKILRGSSITAMTGEAGKFLTESLS
jgi:hypothetical protein